MMYDECRYRVYLSGGREVGMWLTFDDPEDAYDIIDCLEFRGYDVLVCSPEVSDYDFFL